MKLSSIIALAGLLVVAGPLSGCLGGSSGDDTKGDRKEMTDANSLAKKYDGDFDKLSASEKEVVLKMASGNEAQARSLFKLMAHPPGAGQTTTKGGGAPKAAGG